MEENSGQFQAGANLAGQVLNDIGTRLKQARDCLLAGNLDRYYWNLEVITRMIYGFLTTEERKRVLNQEREIQKLLPCREQTKSELSLLLKGYDGIVMMLLNEHEFLVPPKRTRTGLII